MGILILFLVISACSDRPRSFLELVALTEQEEAGPRRQKLKSYLEGQPGLPLVEADKAVFIFEDSSDADIYLAGDMTSWKPDSLKLTRIAGTPFHYLALSLPGDARLEYKFVRANEWLPDPLNPRQEGGAFGRNSVLLMPEYIFPKEILLDLNSRASRLDTLSFRSRLLKNARGLYYYHHRQAGPDAPLIFFHDGSDYLRRAKARIILDNLIASDRIPPVNAVFIDPVNRMKEYWLNAAYVDMLIRELKPYIIKKYNLSTPKRFGMGGASLGGLISLYALVKYPAELDFIFSQSGALQVENGKIIELLKKTDNLKAKMYVDYGTFEGTGSFHEKLSEIPGKENPAFRMQIVHEGHNWGNWRAHLAAALEFCLRE